jgi:biotin carboxylase
MTTRPADAPVTDEHRGHRHRPRPGLLVLGSGDREYRGYMLERIATRYDLALLSPDPPTWERRYIAEHRPIDPADAGSVIRIAVEVAQRRPVAGVITYHEPCVELAAVIGRRLGLPHCDPTAAATCRDKYAARTALQRAGVPSARFRLVMSRDGARAAADEIGYPVVVKPRALSASFGVSLVTDPTELDAAYEVARASTLPEPWAFRHGVLVEEYLTGPEISVDSVVYGDQVAPVIYARKLVGLPPNFEELGHVVAPAEQVVDEPERAGSVVAAAHRAFGMTNAVTHTELRLTAAGPRVVEVNGRSGGGLIPYLARVVKGVDLSLAVADVAAGVVPDLDHKLDGVAGIRFFYPPPEARVVFGGVAPGFVRPPWLHQLTWLLPPGTELAPVRGRLYFARAGYAIVTATTVAECLARMETVDEQVSFHSPPSHARSSG